MKVAVIIDSTVDAKLLIGVYSMAKVDEVVDAYAKKLKDDGQDIILESKATDVELSDENRLVITYMLDGYDEPSFFICVYLRDLDDVSFETDVEIC